jgi:hypothetical protein
MIVKDINASGMAISVRIQLAVNRNCGLKEINLLQLAVSSSIRENFLCAE